MASKTIHLICGPARCIDLVSGIIQRRARIDTESTAAICMMSRPIFVWRPLPCYCTPSELPTFYEALKYVDVISPSFVDLMALFKPHLDSQKLLDKLKISCNILLALGFGNRASAVVVRAGEQGCYVATFQRHTMMPAYHTCVPDHLTCEERSALPSRVVDPAGAADAFLGGFCIGLLNEPHPLGLSEFEVGAIYGSVAASFAIEQFGLPRVEYDSEPSKKERWNNEAVRDRLTEFERRLEMPQLSKQEQERGSLYCNKPGGRKFFEAAGLSMVERIRKPVYWQVVKKTGD